MSGAARTVSIRVSTEGAERARKDLEQFGTAGEAALRRVEGAAAATSPAMQRLAGASDGLARSVAAMPGPMGDAARQIQGFAAGLSVAGGGFAAAAAAAAAFGVAVVASLGATVRVAEQYERLGLRTAAVIKATEGAAGLSAAQIRALAIDIGDVTLASATEVEAAAQKLLTFRSIAGDVFETTMRLAQDLAAVGFGDISGAAVQLGKALGNPVEGLAGLTRIGITFSAAQKAVIKQLDDTGRSAEAQRVILAAVARQVGGAGVAEGGGLSGAYDDLGDNVEKFLLSIGNAGPIQVAMAAIRALGQAVQGLNIIFAAGSRFATGGTALQAADTLVSRAMGQVRAAETPDSYGRINKPTLDAANAVLLEALAARTTIITAAEQAQAGIIALSENARSETARENAVAALHALELSLSARLRAEKEHAAAVITIDRSLREGVRSPDQADVMRTDVTRQRDAALFAAARAAETPDQAMTRQGAENLRIMGATVALRPILRAQIDAEREALLRGFDPARATALVLERVAQATVTASDAATQHAATLTREGQAALAMAGASEHGRAAMLRSKAASEAHALAATQTGTAEAALTQQILNRNAAQAAASGGEAAVALQEQITALRSLIAAEQQGDRAAHWAEIEARVREATRAMEAHREVATDPAISAALTAEIDLVRRRTEEQAALNIELAQQRRLSAGGRELADLRDQTGLLGQSAAVRERELATRRAIRQLEREGFDAANLPAAQQALVDQAAALADANTHLRQQRGLYDGIADSAVQAFTTVGNAITQAFVSGQGAAVNWGNVTRGVVASVLSEIVKLAVINPILNAVLGTERASLFSSTALSGAGGGGGLASLSGIGGALSSGWGALSSGGYFAAGGGGLFGTAATPGVGGIGGEAFMAGSPATSGMFGTGGAFSMGSMGATLGGVAGGFALGSMIGGFIANSQAQRQNSQIGAGIGAAVGAIFGPLGSIIGGAIGGGAGGMFGPGESVQGWGYWLESEEGRLKPIDRQFYNESDARQFAHADQQVAAVNALLEQRGLSVSGSRNVGGNRFGPDASWGGAASFEAAFGDLRFAAANDDRLNAAISGRSFAGPADLQSLLTVSDTIRDLTATPAEKLAAAINAVNAQFDALSAKAREYGLAETGLTEVRSRAIAEVNAQQNAAGHALLADLAFGNQSALAPEQKYFAGLSLLNDARGRLAAGGRSQTTPRPRGRSCPLPATSSAHRSGMHRSSPTWPARSPALAAIRPAWGRCSRRRSMAATRCARPSPATASGNSTWPPRP